MVEETDWFDDEVVGTKHGDFFDKRSINYNKRSKINQFILTDKI